jgi:alpha-ribazole phosphatase
MCLYLLRHGRPEIAPGICYGSSDLDVTAQEHARVASAALPLLPHGAPMISSPLRRCRVLAMQLAAMLGASSLTFDARLAELHFGEWEMQRWDDIAREQVDAWASDPVTYRPGNGESVLQAAQRVHAFYEELMAQDKDSVIIVAHAGTMRLLAECHAGEVSPQQIAHNAVSVRHDIGYGALLVLA